MISKLEVGLNESNNLKVFRLIDDSEYNPKIEVECGILEIKAPGFSVFKKFKVDPYFNMAFNASLLDIAKVKNYRNLIDLPDGIYTIKYSIKPSVELNVEYDYFRVTKLNEKFAKVASDLIDGRCKLTSKEFEKQQKDLIWIRLLIDNAKYKGEECGDPEKAIELYNEASSLLKANIFCKC